MENVNYCGVNQNNTQGKMKVVLFLAVIFAILSVVIATSASIITIIKLQVQDEKMADLERRIENISEAGRIQNVRVRDIEQIINKKK